MGKTFKDRRKFDRKHDNNTEGLKESRREPKKRWVHQEELDEEFDPYSIFDDQYDPAE